ncbi:MAG: hypothetical protein KF886_12775 [Candidatus Hydrogenedentes bacterium]|nr:hypothetical protein [Candidatus Hydrogenedentota bacterium]
MAVFFLAAQSVYDEIAAILSESGRTPQEELVERLVQVGEADANALVQHLAANRDTPPHALIIALAELGESSAVPVLLDSLSSNPLIIRELPKFEHPLLEPLFQDYVKDDEVYVEYRLIAAAALLRSGDAHSRSLASEFVLDVDRVTDSIDRSYPLGGVTTNWHYEEWGAALLEINTPEAIDVMCSWLYEGVMNWNAKKIVDVMTQVKEPSAAVIEKLFFAIKEYDYDATVQLTALESLLRHDNVSIKRIAEYYEEYLAPYDVHELLKSRQNEVKAMIDERLSRVETGGGDELARAEYSTNSEVSENGELHPSTTDINTPNTAPLDEPRPSSSTGGFGSRLQAEDLDTISATSANSSPRPVAFEEGGTAVRTVGVWIATSFIGGVLALGLWRLGRRRARRSG